MAIGDKPASQPQWADGGSAQITEPSSGKKTLGWVKEKPSFAFFNWFWNLVYQWTAFLQSYAENHVHDGGSSDLSAPKVDLQNHIDYGSNGDLQVTVDSGSEHRIRHEATGTSVNEVDVTISGLYRVDLSATEYVELQDASGLSGARQLQISGPQTTGVRTAALFLTQATSPGGDFATLHPMDSSLYLRSIPKALGKFNFTESGGTISNAAVSIHNATGNWVTGGAPAGTFLLTVPDHTNISGNVQASVSVNQAGSDTNQYKADIDWDATNNRLVLRLYYFDSTSNVWLNVRTSGPPTGMDCHVQHVVS